MNHSQALTTIQQQLEHGAIESATHRCALDALGVTAADTTPESLNCMTAAALEQWHRRYALH